MTSKSFQYAIAIVAGFAALSVGDDMTSGQGISTAQAYIGNPLTPMSYAGVARRTTRRAAYAGTAYGGYGAAYAPPVYAAPPVVAAPPVYAAAPRQCAQVADAYGQVYSRC